MVLFYLTTMSLDLLWGLSYWIVGKTTNGIYRLVFKKKDIDDKLDQLIAEKDIDRMEIARLNKKIEFLTDYLVKIEKDK